MSLYQIIRMLHETPSFELAEPVDPIKANGKEVRADLLFDPRTESPDVWKISPLYGTDKGTNPLSINGVLLTKDNQLVYARRGGAATPERISEQGVTKFCTIPGGKAIYDQGTIRETTQIELREEVSPEIELEYAIPIALTNVQKPGPGGNKIVVATYVDATANEIKTILNEGNQIYKEINPAFDLKSDLHQKAQDALRSAKIGVDVWESYDPQSLPADPRSIDAFLQENTTNFTGFGAGSLAAVAKYLRLV